MLFFCPPPPLPLPRILNHLPRIPCITGWLVIQVNQANNQQGPSPPSTLHIQGCTLHSAHYCELMLFEWISSCSCLVAGFESRQVSANINFSLAVQYVRDCTSCGEEVGKQTFFKSPQIRKFFDLIRHRKSPNL
jgi:hypothetical protein